MPARKRSIGIVQQNAGKKGPVYGNDPPSTHLTNKGGPIRAPGDRASH
jgi:hypothetical protein